MEEAEEGNGGSGVKMDGPPVVMPLIALASWVDLDSSEL